jgi:hypothetical protein
LIEVAHPRWREELLTAAKKLGYIRADQYLASHASYSVHEERIVTMKNSAKVMIRPARAADAETLQGLFHRLTEDDIYTRFFRRVRSLSYRELQTLCNVNHETDVAFLGVVGPRENEEIIGSACYFLNPTSQSRRGSLHGCTRISRGGAWNCAASVPSGVRHEPRRPRVCLRDPVAHTSMLRLAARAQAQ